MKERLNEKKPMGVKINSKQVGEIYGRWPWVERNIWTERMLAALETGVKGGVWFSLIDKVHSKKHLNANWEKVRTRKGVGVDGQTAKDFDSRREHELDRLAEELRTGTYQPRPVKRVYIPKPGSKEKRPLGIPTIRDRVVQASVRNVIMPIFEKKFAEHSYGFRPKRGCKDALRRVQELLNKGYTWVVDADIQKYFDNIPHDLLLKEIEKDISDGRILNLIRKFLEQGVMDGLETWSPEAGTPQGAIISPLLANIFFHPVDVEIAEAGFEMVRYADDVLILCRTESEAKTAMELFRQKVESRGLSLHPTKSRIAHMTVRDGIEFLGYHFRKGKRWANMRSIKKLRNKIRVKTRRNNGKSLTAIINDINPILRGWFEYFKHSHPTTFSTVDGWVRSRLRSILRRRLKGKGRSRGIDHYRWPNAYFRRAGFFSLVEARANLCRS